MRGKALKTDFLSPTFWITPAYAGKSCADNVVSIKIWDHPRLCGEK